MPEHDRLAALERALALAMSMIRGGEEMSEQAESIFRTALSSTARPAPAGVVVPRDVADNAAPFLAMLTDPGTGDVIRYMSAAAKAALSALAAALREGDE